MKDKDFWQSLSVLVCREERHEQNQVEPELCHLNQSLLQMQALTRLISLHPSRV